MQNVLREISITLLLDEGDSKIYEPTNSPV